MRILLWLVGVVLGLVVLILIAIQLPPVQNFARKQIVQYVSGKIGTPFAIQKLKIHFPKAVVLEGLYAEDQTGDTLLAAGKIKVDIGMFALLFSEVNLSTIALDNITAKVKRDSLGVFNFDYAINAFTGNEETPADTSGGMRINIGDVLLDNVRVLYKDDYAGYDLVAGLQHFDTRFNKFDIDSMRFVVEGINLNGVQASFRQYKPLAPQIEEDKPVEGIEDPATMPDLKFGPIALQDINIDYNNSIESIAGQLNMGKLLLQIQNTDLRNKQIIIDNIALDQTSGAFELGASPAAKEVARKVSETVDTTIDKAADLGWMFSVKNTDLKEISFRYNDNNAPTLTRGIDYSHLDIQHLTLQANDIYFRSDSTSAAVLHLALQEKSGLDVQELKGNLLYTNNEAYLRDFQLRTPRTSLQHTIGARYPSLAAVGKNINLLFIDAILQKSSIAVSDILIFVPDLIQQPFFATHRNDIVNIDGAVQGPLSNLSIPSLRINAFGEGIIDISGKLANVTDPDRLSADLTIRQLSTTDRALKGMLPKGTIPDNITLPRNMNITGRIAGNMQRMNVNLKGITSMGNLSIAGTLAQFTNAEKATYDLQTSMKGFQLGKLLGQDSTLGSTSFALHVKGKGFNPQTLNAHADGTIEQLQYNGYNYHNLVLEADATAGTYVFDAKMDDPNADFALTGTLDLTKEAPAFTAQLAAERIDLLQLGFMTDTVVVHAKMDANFPIVDMAKLTGEMTISDIQLGVGNRLVNMDTVRLKAVNVDSNNSLSLKSPIADAAINGVFQYDQIGAAFTHVIDQYFDIGEIDSLDNNQQVGFAIRIFSSPILAELLPELSLQDTLSLIGAVNTNPTLLFSLLRVPELAYGKNKIEKAVAAVRTEGDELKWEADIDHASTSLFDIPRATLGGTMANNNLRFDIGIRDIADSIRYKLGGNVLEQNRAYRLSLDHDGVVLNYKPWVVGDSNIIVYSDSGIYANKFVLTSEAQSLTLQSEPIAPNANLGLTFKDFEISTVTDILQKDSLHVEGTINGEVGVANLGTSPIYLGAILVDNFAFNGDTLGQLSLSAFQTNPDRVAAGLVLQGEGNDIQLGAAYKISSKEYNGTLDVKNLNLSTLEGFMMGAMRDMQGTAKGALEFRGTMEQLSVNGKLSFDTAAFRVKQLNSLYRLNSESIVFRDNTVNFSDFTVRDSANNEAVINGNIIINSFADITLGLQLEADDFELIKSTAADNQLFYGDLNVDASLQVKGSVELPEVSGNLRVNENTDFTFVLPEEDPEVSQREGIVEFFDQDAPVIDSTYIAPQTAINVATTKGMNLMADVEIDKDAEFTIIVDVANGDFLDVKGEGNLSAAMNKDGEISLTGTYELKQGNYAMSITLLKRNFEIESGSTLTWQGSPTEATVEITAIYKAKAAPIDLLGSQISDLSPEARNAYKQRLPFDVKLMMKGELLKPEISFDITLPEGNYNVSSEVVEATRLKLEQIRREPAEQNKQVLSLLALGRFVEDDPFSSGSSTSYAVLARQSVSKLLTEQINNLASSLVKGVDINVGLDSEDDYSTGSQKTRTDLNVGVSKTLLNDRLKVTVGSNFQVEGPQLQGQQTNNIAGDVRMDYMLSKDGRYSLHAYRRNQYQVSLQGQVVETGLGFVLSMDYDKFRELFEAAKEKKKLKKEAKTNQ